MRSVRSLLVGALLVGLTTLAACGGNQASSAAATATQGSGSSTDESTGGEPSNPPEATPTENAGPSDGGSNLDSVVNALTPPNSHQLSRTEAGGGVVISWESTDSADSLKSFYEGKIPSTGMKIISTTNASGSFSWIFAQSEGSTQGGSVTVGPSSTGGSGSSVILAYTTQ